MERMNTLDAEFFFAEHDHVPLHIGSVAVFAGPAPSHTELIRVFEAKLPLVPRYRQAVRTTPLNCSISAGACPAARWRCPSRRLPR